MVTFYVVFDKGQLMRKNMTVCKAFLLLHLLFSIEFYFIRNVCYFIKKKYTTEAQENIDRKKHVNENKSE